MLIFLQNFELVVDLHGQCLRDQETHLKACGVVKSDTSLHSTVAQASEDGSVSKLIQEYSSKTIPYFNKEAQPLTTTHYIETIGQPIHNRAKCQASDKLKFAKAEFQQMMKLGIFVLQKASGLHHFISTIKSLKHGVLEVITEL